jgi:hypothetical protein
VSPYTGSSYTVSTGVTEGGTYKFKARARNIYGWGPYSTEVSIIASDVPSQMGVATTSIVGVNARIAWTAPSSNGEDITSYLVEVLDSDGSTFTQESGSCPGSDPAVLYCDIPLTTLRASPYDLVLGDLV